MSEIPKVIHIHGYERVDEDDYDREAQRILAKNAFSEERIRRGFIRKVYMIVMFQLMLTFGALVFVMNYEPAQIWILQNSRWMFLVAIVILFTSMCAMACCGDLRKTTPYNYLLLGVFTIAESFLLSVITIKFPSGVILMAVGLTTIVVLVLTIFAMQTKIDFTACGGILLIAGVIFIIFGIVVMFFPSHTLIYVQASIGVALFSIYLIYDTQLMMGGNRKNVISPEDYIFAALSIYLDIINIFMYILVLLGITDD